MKRPFFIGQIPGPERGKITHTGGFHFCAGCERQGIEHTICSQVTLGDYTNRKDLKTALDAQAKGLPIPINSATIGTWKEGSLFVPEGGKVAAAPVVVEHVEVFVAAD